MEEDLGSLKQLSDCYFYLNSSCSKGDSCPFRHSPAALSNNRPCKRWLTAEGCSNENCGFRHPSKTSPLLAPKDRSTIPCYWLTQPSGCLKGSDCPFLHGSPSSKPASAKNVPAATEPLPAQPEVKKVKPTAAAGEKKMARSVFQSSLADVKRDRSGISEAPRAAPEQRSSSAASSQVRGATPETARKSLDFGIKSLDELRRAGNSQPPAPSAEQPASKAAAPVPPAASPKAKPAAAASSVPAPAKAKAHARAVEPSTPAALPAKPSAKPSPPVQTAASKPAAKPAPKPSPSSPAPSHAPAAVHTTLTAPASKSAPPKRRAEEAVPPPPPKIAKPAPPIEDDLEALERELAEAGVQLSASGGAAADMDDIGIDL